jgi:ABC-type multidrug transport system fused ATPase/permease subunit
VESESLLRDIYRSALPSIEREPLPSLPRGLYAFVLRISAPQQLRLCLLTALIFPLSMIPLELQRRIVNGVTKGEGEIALVLTLGAIYLGVVLLQGALKYIRNIYLGRVSEGVIRSLRTRLLRALPGGGDDKSEVGSRISMIAVETEQLGGFVGEALAQPLLSAGVLLTVSAYMLWTAPLIALVAFAFFVPAVLIAPWLQSSINRHSRDVTEQLRELSNQVVLGDGSQAGGDAASDPLEGLTQRIYHSRIRLFAVKFFAKFFNNILSSIGQLAVLIVGAVLVMKGQTDIGVVVAFMSGFDRISEPAHELMNFYRLESQMRIQYRLLQEVTPAVQSPEAPG